VTSRIAVVGGGVAGLATAHHLLRSGADLVLFEREEVPGGIVAPPVEVGDLWLEPGPDSFAARKPWGASLCRELGLTLIPPAASGAYLWTETGLVSYLPGTPFGIPGDVGDVLRWPGLSARGRLRALGDLLRSTRKDGVEETLGGLLRRRLGDEATDLAIAPLLAGLHAGDVDRLSARATFPELVAWEASQGSLIRGAQAAQRSARRADPGPLFLRPRGGMRELVDALTRELRGRIRTRAEVVGVGDGEIRVHDDVERADATVIACDAASAAAILGTAAPGGLHTIHAVSTAVVFLVYPPGTAEAPPSGTGFVVPRGEAPMTAATFISRKWPEDAFGSRAVVRCYVGGAGMDDVLEAPDDDIVAACARHLGAAMDLPAPSASRVHRWWRAMPQYELGHLERVRRIREALPPGIFLVGSSFDGVGVSDVARAAEETAAQALAHMGAPRKEPA
jgi:oxygen-dependent protoporphyrinogen oxidase